MLNNEKLKYYIDLLDDGNYLDKIEIKEVIDSFKNKININIIFNIIAFRFF